MREQGAMVECVYCKFVKPDLKGTELCPQCHGTTPAFKAMRMMDQDTSGQKILHTILDMQYAENYEVLRKDLLHLLTRIDVYNFDLKSALILFLQTNEP